MIYKHAVVALDLSPSSKAMVHCLPQVFSDNLERVTLLTVVSRPYPGGTEKFDTTTIREKLESYKEYLNAKNLQADIELVVDSTAYAPEAITSKASELKADILVIGNRGQNRLSSMFLGSVVAEVLQRITIPTLLLRISDESNNNIVVSSCDNITNHVLVPVDFSRTTSQLIDGLIQSKLKSSKLTLMHISDGDKNGIEKLDALRKKLLDNGFQDVHTELSNGKPFSRIVEFAHSNQISLIIMGSQGKGYMDDLFIGSESQRVARYTHLPLLLIPSKQ